MIDVMVICERSFQYGGGKVASIKLIETDGKQLVAFEKGDESGLKTSIYSVQVFPITIAEKFAETIEEWRQ